jgi:hypothetical protein
MKKKKQSIKLSALGSKEPVKGGARQATKTAKGTKRINTGT